MISLVSRTRPWSLPTCCVPSLPSLLVRFVPSLPPLGPSVGERACTVHTRLWSHSPVASTTSHCSCRDEQAEENVARGLGYVSGVGGRRGEERGVIPQKSFRNSIPRSFVCDFTYYQWDLRATLQRFEKRERMTVMEKGEEALAPFLCDAAVGVGRGSDEIRRFAVAGRRSRRFASARVLRIVNVSPFRSSSASLTRIAPTRRRRASRMLLPRPRMYVSPVWTRSRSLSAGLSCRRGPTMSSGHPHPTMTLAQLEHLIEPNVEERFTRPQADMFAGDNSGIRTIPGHPRDGGQSHSPTASGGN